MTQQVLGRVCCLLVCLWLSHCWLLGADCVCFLSFLPALNPTAAKYTKRGSIGLRVRVVGANYRPDPSAALTFCEHGGPSSNPDPRSTRCLSASVAESSRCSTPRDVLTAPAGVPNASARAAAAAGGKRSGAAAHVLSSAGSGHPLYRPAGDPGPEHVEGDGDSAAVGAAALLNQHVDAAAGGVPQTIMSSVTEVDGWCSVHSQADPQFVSEWRCSSLCIGPARAVGLVVWWCAGGLKGQRNVCVCVCVCAGVHKSRCFASVRFASFSLGRLLLLRWRVPSAFSP